MSKKNRILHIIGQLGIGGAERQLFLLLKGLNSRYSFIVVSYDEKRLDYMADLQSLGVDVKIIPKRSGLTGRLKFFIELRNLIRIIDPDIIQTWLRSANFWGRFACLVSGKRGSVIASIRNVGEADKKILEKLGERFLAKKTDLIIANTTAAKNAMVRNKISQQKIRVIHNGIDPKIYYLTANKEQIRQELSLPQHKLLIGTVGRMEPQKNHTMFVEVARKILGKRSNVHFVMIGDGELRRDIEGLISRYGLSEVFTLTGQRQDVPRLLKALDIFVLTSLWEGLPNVIMEAMCARLPVISTNVGGVSELITDGENGFLVYPTDVESMVNALERLIDDSNLCLKFGIAGYKIIEKKFSIDQMCKATSEIYDDLLQKNY